MCVCVCMGDLSFWLDLLPILSLLDFVTSYLCHEDHVHCGISFSSRVPFFAVIFSLPFLFC